MTSETMLQLAISQGIIDLSFVEEKIEMTKREQYLKQHPHEIWQGKNGSWYTYIPDRKKGRVLKRKATKEAIENEIIAYWKAQAENPSVRDVFCEWNDYRLELQKITNSTHMRNRQTFDRHYSEFGKRKIKDISPGDVEDFLERQVPKYHLTARGFANLKSITKGFLKRAKKRQLIDFNVEELFQELDTSEMKFTQNYKEDYEEVYDDEEMETMMNYLEENLDINNLAIYLMFLTGARVGEVVTLKHTDFDGNTFKVRRTETRYKGSDGKDVYAVKETPKSQAGIRTVIIPQEYSWVADTIRQTNPEEEYIFVKNGKRMTTNAIRRRLSRLCTKLNIYQKSPHKIRKTYGSILLDNHVDNLLIIQQMGHTDISCTENYYHRNRKKLEQKSMIISSLPEFRVKRA